MKMVRVLCDGREVQVEFNAFLDIVKTAALAEHADCDTPDVCTVAADLFNAVGHPGFMAFESAAAFVKRIG